jgi:magnesium transporter
MSQPADTPPERDEPHHQDDVQDSLREVQVLLARQKRVENLVHRQDMPRHELVENLVHKQHVAELRQQARRAMHPADIAYILEALPLDERLLVWDLVKAERDGEILLEVSDAVRESLIENMAPSELVAAAEQLDADELADLAPDLPQGGAWPTCSARCRPKSASNCAPPCPTRKIRSAR